LISYKVRPHGASSPCGQKKEVALTKQNRSFIVVILCVLMLISIGCGYKIPTPTKITRENTTNLRSYDRFYNDPRIDTQVNDQFDFLFDVCEIQQIEGGTYLVLKVIVWPKYFLKYRNFVINLEWNETVASGIVSGFTSYPVNMPVDIREDADYIGYEFGNHLAVKSDEELADAGLARESLLEQAKIITILLEYDGKKVSFPLTYRGDIKPNDL